MCGRRLHTLRMARIAQRSDCGTNCAKGRYVKSRLQRHVHMTGFGVCVLAMGLLIWARLMLVTSHPRTAIAEPQASTGVAVQMANAASEAKLDAEGR